ncbi:acyltransferase family protein [Adhaeribacter soli]|uniref:Acyltransferase n=1 Tax=Adhaeribacter soli TaxID=2607655 RepID=A0A5N1IP30_9BACT|nr:acyltransferase [Adhaeribacter soli]KAA9327383.1 acyltransferase [Adhaeribacter soli]
MLSVNKLTLLHAIRGFAAFYVVVAHAKFPLWSGGKAYLEKFPRESWTIADYLLFALDMLSSNGTAMVIVFYVLSGFFIAYSFDKNNWSLRRFYTNRLVRIYLPFLASMIFAVGVLHFLANFLPSAYNSPVATEFSVSLKEAYSLLNLKSVLLGLAFLPNGNQYIGYNFPYWSLLYEGIFYLIAPWVIRFPKSYLGISVIGFLCPYLFGFHPKVNPFVHFISEFSIFFAIGICTYWLVKKQTGLSRIRPLALTLSLGVMFPLIIGLGVAGYYQPSFLLAGLFASGLIYLFLHFSVPDNIVIRFFKEMGKISYTLYLFHFPVLILVFGIIHKITGKYLFYDRIYWIGVLAAVLVSYPVYYLVEEKSLKAISRLKKKPAPAPVLK